MSPIEIYLSIMAPLAVAGFAWLIIPIWRAFPDDPYAPIVLHTKEIEK
jgi:hypothetical protein